MIQSLKHSWRREATQRSSAFSEWWLIAVLTVRLFSGRRLERIRFADTNISYLYKCDVRFRFRTETHYAYGVGFSVREAVLKALAEATERSVSYGANEDMCTHHESSDVSITYNAFEYAQIRTVTAAALDGGADIRIPAHCIRRWNRALDGAGQHLFPYTTSGIAAHVDAQRATQNALNEVIERDAFLCYWYSRSAPLRVVMDAVPKHIQALLVAYQNLGLSIDILYLQHETQVPVIAVVGSLNKDGIVRRVLSLGCKESFDEAIVSALQEFCIVKSHLYATADEPASYDEITAFGRARLWRGALCTELDYFLEGKQVAYTEISQLVNASQKEIHEPKDAVVYTYSASWNSPLVVVKVIIPSYFPFFLNERYKHFGKERVRHFCESHGIPCTMSEIPHVLP